MPGCFWNAVTFRSASHGAAGDNGGLITFDDEVPTQKKKKARPALPAPAKPTPGWSSTDALVVRAGPSQQTPPPASLGIRQAGPSTWFGPRPSEDALKALAEAGVRTIVNLEDYFSQSAAGRRHEQQRALAHGIRMIWCPVSPLPFFALPKKRLENLLRHLRAPGVAPFYVHCYFGRERTNLLVALNQRYNEGRDAKDCYKDMLAAGYRGWLVPTLHFGGTSWLHARTSG